MSAFQYETDQFPLVIFRCPARFEADETRTVLARYEREVLSARRTFALIVDATEVEVLPSAIVRRVITDWMIPAQALGEKQMVGMAVATSSALIRGAMTAIHWVVPGKIPSTYEATRYDAARWSLERLRERDAVIPESVIAYVDSLGAPKARSAGGR